MMKSLLMLLLPVIVLSSDLNYIFQNPPHDAKPRGYWVWPHGNFDYESISYELKEFKEKGLAGVDIFDLGIGDPKNIIPAGPEFMSPEQVDGIAFALQEAEKLGLKMGLIVSSSWNAGATWTKPEHAWMNMLAYADTVAGPIHYTQKLPFPEIPKTFEKPYGTFDLNVPMSENGLPTYYKDLAVIAFPLDENGKLVDPDQIKYIEKPHVIIDLPKGKWVVMRFVGTNFGQMLWVASKNSKALSMDHFSKEATAFHFNEIINRLEDRIGPLDKTALERLYLASYESNANVIWTPGFFDEFEKLNGYKIQPFLPALFGTIVKNENTTERFLYDFRKTASELFINNLYRTARDICHDHGLKIACEAGGPGPPLHYVPTEDLKALGSLDVMRGEFWVDKKGKSLDADGHDLLQVVKGIASAAHIYGHKIVEMESFTSHVNWQEGPSVFKPLADKAFCEGMNRVVYHTMSHNVPEAGKPGWTFGAGTHMNTNLTWWHESMFLHTYLARCSAMLQQGLFVADAAFYCGSEIPNIAKPKHVRATLGRGYDYDDINTEILLTASVVDGRVTLPSGMSYPVLVLPNDVRMELEVLKKIDKLLQAGATIVGPKPQRVYGLADYLNQEKELQVIADRLWGKRNQRKLDKKVGSGRLVVGKSVRRILQDNGIAPDVEFLHAPADTTFDFIHRRTEIEDIYFIRNTHAHPVYADAVFRVHGKQPQLWNAVTGDRQPCLIYHVEENRVRLPLKLPAHGSVFVVFTDALAYPYITAVTYNKKQIFPKKRACDVSFQTELREGQLLFSAEDAGTFQVTMNTGEQERFQVSEPSALYISGSWDVRFPPEQGVQTIQTFDSLYSWTDSSDPETRFFSGTATYRKAIQVPDSLVSKNQTVILELGDVRELARVYLNGKELIAGFAPHQFDVTDCIRAGDNFLVIKVTNTWLNRLVGDHRKPQDERVTQTNLTRGPTSATAWKDAEPKKSGLLGPVLLKVRSELIVEIQ